jgi:hypothetical protein
MLMKFGLQERQFVSAVSRKLPLSSLENLVLHRCGVAPRILRWMQRGTT